MGLFDDGMSGPPRRGKFQRLWRPGYRSSELKLRRTSSANQAQKAAKAGQAAQPQVTRAPGANPVQVTAIPPKPVKGPPPVAAVVSPAKVQGAPPPPAVVTKTPTKTTTPPPPPPAPKAQEVSAGKYGRRLSGLGDVTVGGGGLPPEGDSTTDPVDQQPDEQYVPNATVWVSVDKIQLYWFSLDDIRRAGGKIYAGVIRGDGVPTDDEGGNRTWEMDGLVQFDAHADPNNPVVARYMSLGGGPVAVSDLRDKIMWPNGAPMVGRVWMPRALADGSPVALPGLPGAFSRMVAAPWFEASPLQRWGRLPSRYRQETCGRPMYVPGASMGIFGDYPADSWLNYLCTVFPGYKLLGTNFGNNDGSPRPGAPWRQGINAISLRKDMPPLKPIPDELLGSPWGPVATFTPCERWYNGLFDAGGDTNADAAVGYVYFDQYTIAAAFDWSKQDPTTAAYPWLYDVLSPELLGWQSYLADLWRSDLEPINKAGLAPALAGAPWPFHCLEFLDAMVTGKNGMPVLVTDDGILDIEKLQKWMDTPPWDRLRTVWKKGAAFNLATIYDNLGQTIGAGPQQKGSIALSRPLGFQPAPHQPVSEPPADAQPLPPEEAGAAADVVPDPGAAQPPGQQPQQLPVELPPDTEPYQPPLDLDPNRAEPIYAPPSSWKIPESWYADANAPGDDDQVEIIVPDDDEEPSPEPEPEPSPEEELDPDELVVLCVIDEQGFTRCINAPRWMADLYAAPVDQPTQSGVPERVSAPPEGAIPVNEEDLFE